MQMEIVLTLPALFVGATVFRKKYHKNHFSFRESILFAVVTAFALYIGMVLGLQLL